LFDIPYSWEAVKQVDEKVEEVKSRLNDMDREVFYAAINTFKAIRFRVRDGSREVEQEIMQTGGLVPVEKIAEMFTPKIRTERIEKEKRSNNKRHPWIWFQARNKI